MSDPQSDGRKARYWCGRFDGPAVTAELAARGWTADWEYPGFIGVTNRYAASVYFTIGEVNEELGLQVMNEDGSECEHAEDLVPAREEDVQRLSGISGDADRGSG